MKISKKNLKPFILIIFLGLIIGTLAWEIVERIISQSGYDLSLNTEPVGFNIGVISLYVKINIGSLLGTAGGALLFRSI